MINKMKLSTYTPIQLSWYPNIMRIPTIGDGSCFFHAIAMAYCKIYRDGDDNFKKDFIRQLRYQLTLALGERYTKLSRGELPSLSKEMPRYTLDAMQRELNSSSPVDNLYLELCSEVLGLDIYIIDVLKRDVYIVGDKELLSKSRNAVVLGYTPGHYELVGALERETFLRTLFPPDHLFITTLKSRF